MRAQAQRAIYWNNRTKRGFVLSGLGAFVRTPFPTAGALGDDSFVGPVATPQQEQYANIESAINAANPFPNLEPDVVMPPASQQPQIMTLPGGLPIDFSPTPTGGIAISNALAAPFAPGVPGGSFMNSLNAWLAGSTLGVKNSYFAYGFAAIFLVASLGGGKRRRR